MSINYVIGDATQPVGDGPKIIVHVCNDIGGWGRGFVVALSKRWPEPEGRYRAWHRGEEKAPFALGEVQFVQVSEGRLGGERDWPTRRPDGRRCAPGALRRHREGTEASCRRSEPHRRFSSHAADRMRTRRRQWEEVGRIVEQQLVNNGVPVTVYDLAV